MAAPQVAAMAPKTALVKGCTVEFVAISATTGAAVAGVKVSLVSILADAAGDAQLVSSGPFMLVPGPEA